MLQGGAEQLDVAAVPVFGQLPAAPEGLPWLAASDAAEPVQQQAADQQQHGKAADHMLQDHVTVCPTATVIRPFMLCGSYVWCIQQTLTQCEPGQPIGVLRQREQWISLLTVNK